MMDRHDDFHRENGSFPASKKDRVTQGRTDGQTDGRTDTTSYRDARKPLKKGLQINIRGNGKSWQWK